jgi:CRISPR-associated protein Csm5
MSIFKQNYSNKKILKITTLSPLNIGCGDFYTNLDYYIEDNKAKIIDIERMMDSIGDIDKINQMQNQMQKLIKSYMGNNKLTISIKELYEGIGIYPDEFISKEIDCKIKKDASVQVAKFINQNGNYYIPGSSLKGAIRTAYIFDYYDKNINKLIGILKDNSIPPFKKGSAVVENAIGRIKDDFFKHLLITDSNIISPENFEFINTIRYNTNDARIGKKSNNIPEPKESLKKDSEFKMELTIKKDFPKNFEEIKNMCNKFSKTIAEFEVNNKYLPKETSQFYNNLLDNIKNNDNSFYLALGSGSSYLSKTIYLLLWKHDKGNSKGYLKIMKNLFERERNPNLRKSWKSARHFSEFPRTRVIETNKEIPIGWIKITAE